MKGLVVRMNVDREEMLYISTMNIAKKLYLEGLISEGEYSEINTIFTNKYKPKFGVLFADIALINMQKNANICPGGTLDE